MHILESVLYMVEGSQYLQRIQAAEKWEVSVVRDLAKNHAAICHSDKNLKAKGLWKAFNAMEATPPPLNLQYFHAIREVLPLMPKPKTIHLAAIEMAFALQSWHFNNIDDDQVFDPWLQVSAERYTVTGTWGIEQERVSSDARSWRIMPSITKIDDIDRLIATPHRVINADPPLAQTLRSFLGDIMPVHVNKGTVYSWWNGVDLSETMNRLLGMEEFMMLMYDDPQLIHALMSKIRDGVIANLDQVTQAGDWSTCDGYNHAMLPTNGLPDAMPCQYDADPKSLWWFMHGQEFELCSSEQHDEFLLQYQLPIMEKFGLISYGCCESLDRKVDMLRQIKNLRRICVGPKATLKTMAEHVKMDYILSWRPISTIINQDYSRDGIRNLIRNGLVDAGHCHLEIILKDIMTFNGHPERMFEFARIYKEERQDYLELSF